MACEMFVLEDRDFRLPGLGSYIQIAANSGNIEYVMYGLGMMILLIVIIDLFYLATSYCMVSKVQN